MWMIIIEKLLEKPLKWEKCHTKFIKLLHLVTFIGFPNPDDDDDGGILIQKLCYPLLRHCVCV